MLVCSPLLTSHKWRELVPSGRLVCRCHDVFLWCYVCFVLLRFRLHAFVEAAALRSIVFRYTGAPIATRVCFYFFGESLFPSIFCTISAFSLYGEYVVRSFLPNVFFFTSFFLHINRSGLNHTQYYTWLPIRYVVCWTERDHRNIYQAPMRAKEKHKQKRQRERNKNSKIHMPEKDKRRAFHRESLA